MKKFDNAFEQKQYDYYLSFMGEEEADKFVESYPNMLKTAGIEIEINDKKYVGEEAINLIEQKKSIFEPLSYYKFEHQKIINDNGKISENHYCREYNNLNETQEIANNHFEPISDLIIADKIVNNENYSAQAIFIDHPIQYIGALINECYEYIANIF